MVTRKKDPALPTFGTAIESPTAQYEKLKLESDKSVESTNKIKCINSGGQWDEITKTCSLPTTPTKEPYKIDLPKEEGTQIEPPKVDATGIETFTDSETGRASGVRLPDGRIFLGLNPQEVAEITQQEQSRTDRPEGTAPVGTAQAQSDVAFRGEQLTSGVGQFDQMGVSPTGLDTGEALTQGVVGSIPSAIRMAGQFAAGGAALGAVGAPATGGLSIAAGAAIGAGVGFVAGITGGMISNFKSQRSDTTTAQQRTLDEGKQTLKDWATLAKNDPANKAYYLAEYNKQSAQIDQAHRQMKLDTSRDVAKFETALPNLAEFESFYSTGGERDTLDIEMRNALMAQSPPNYDVLEMAYRRRE